MGFFTTAHVVPRWKPFGIGGEPASALFRDESRDTGLFCICHPGGGQTARRRQDYLTYQVSVCESGKRVMNGLTVAEYQVASSLYHEVGMYGDSISIAFSIS